MRLVPGAVTDKGRVREGNEDGFVVDETMGLFAVADGMGGHQAGEVASRTAIEALRAAVASGNSIRDAIEKANTAVLERSGEDVNLRGMGTTMTAGTLAAGGTLVVGHVGDSRAYLARDGELRQITEDHSLVEEMVRGGELTPEQAEVHPQRSIITRALGIEPQLEVDVYPVQLRNGDRILLCSDGLTTMLRPEEITAILGREPDPTKAAQQLVDAANAAGGEDNITALVVGVTGEAEPAAEVAEAAPAAPAVAPVQEPEPVPPAPPGPSAPARPRRRRAGIGRALVWALPALAVLGLGLGVVAWQARRTYFVEIADGQVTIFKGVRGGLLFWDPTVERRTNLDERELTPAQVNDLEGGKRFSSRGSADDFVADLRADVQRERSTTSSTTTSSSTTSTSTTPTTGAPPTPFP